MTISDSLTPDERKEWKEWVAFQRETNIRAMAKAAIAMLFVPRSSDEMNIEYAVQLGAAILLEKPILLLVAPGVEIPARLRQIADEIVEVDYDDLDSASDELRAKIEGLMREHADR